MDEDPSSAVLDGEVVGIRFCLATRQEVCTASMSDSAVSHASQLSNPFLGLPLEYGRCDSCGASEPGKCEGHFGYIELPVPIYHPSHVSELKRMLSLVCLKCLKMKKNKIPATSNGIAQKLLASCCEDVSQISIREAKTTDGACYLALKIPSRSRLPLGFWNFLEKYGYRYGDEHTRPLLAFEVMEIFKKIPQETRKKLSGKGYFPQDGYVLKYLPVPPNCLSVPEVSDGISVMSTDPSMTMLKKLLRKIEIIKSSRSGQPNFESHQVEANDLQSVVDQYLQLRGTAKASRDIETRFGVNKELNESSTKAWLEKMRTLFIRKGSGFSSRSVITGDAYKRINEIGIPLEVAQRITFEEKVNIHNMRYLQDLVDRNLCLTYREGLSTYSLREGSKGHIYLKPGQIVHRRIMDGDIVFINRPPTTHKHSLQALAVYIHDDNTVKINPLICGPLGADFDGDCIHLFYPQSLAARAEVLELFSVEKQLLSSHSGNLNLQLATDSLLSLRMLFKRYFLNKVAAHQLAMFLSLALPQPALLKANSSGPCWTAVQMLQCALPPSFDCTGDRYLTRESEILEFDGNKDVLPSMINEIAASIFFGKGPGEVMRFFDMIQPFLMESLFSEGFSVSLQDFTISRAAKRNINRKIGQTSPLLHQLRSKYNELVQQQLEKHIQDVKQPVVNFALKSTGLGDLVESKSESSIDKVVQQIGFLGVQLSDRGKFYSKTLIEDVASLFHGKYCHDGDDYPSAEYGLLRGCFIHGLDPYEEIVHSIATREVIVRSSRGLSEPGTLFKNLMAILRDVVICYDGTVRNVCSNSIIQFEYGAGTKTEQLFPAGEPVGVLAATSMSNPAYKAVLDSSPSSNSSWDLMKEILLCKVSFRNEPIDRRVILYLNDCDCVRSYCQEKAAYLVKNQLEKVTLEDTVLTFLIEYQKQQTGVESFQTTAGLVGHIHLDEVMLKELKIDVVEVLQRCQETIKSFHRKKNVGSFFKKTDLDSSASCSFEQSSSPCVMFRCDVGDGAKFDKISNILTDIICPVLLKTVIKGDPRISSASIIWASPDTNTWVQNPHKSRKGELALDVILEKTAVKQSGDAWRIVLDSCLPVLHLIDTRRSIPYAIKQVQELLGISCAFDQAVQRLQASVKMVAKGVLREHLILLASSMTCGGNLVGFNTGGYKALSRQLNVHVPFTEATLFTPRKCFERAAEKCHTDSLSSIVASCSWGKPVAVGTGSRFDVFWDSREVKSNEFGGMGVYDFLHMVKGTSGEGINHACLGDEVDDLMEEENFDWGMSPEHTSGFDAIFEENGEHSVVDLEENSDWTGKAQKKEKSSPGWGPKKFGGNLNSEEGPSKAWEDNPWDSQNVSNQAKTSWRKPDSADHQAWDSQNVSHPAASPSEKPKLPENQVWNSQKVSNQVGSSWQKPKSPENLWDSHMSNKAARSWEKPKSTENQVWDSQNVPHKDARSWEKPKSSENQVWDSQNVLHKDTSSWEKPKFQENQGWDTVNGLNWAPSSWEKPKSGEHQVWGSQNLSPKAASSWGKPKSEENQGWDTQNGSQNESDQSASSWEKPKSSKNKVWDSQNVSPKAASSWEKPKSQENQDWVTHNGSNQAASSWGTSNSHENKGWDAHNWSKQAASSWSKPKSQENQVWGSQNESHAASSQGWDSQVMDSQKVSNQGASSWANPKSPENEGSEKLSNQTTNAHGWDSQNDVGDTDSEKKHQWGKQGRGSFKKNRFDGSQSRGSNAGDWKNKNRPTKSPGMSHHETSGMYTVTRQRKDIFTAEEEGVLTDVESIMQSIRRIMQQTGYNDGDPLAAEDQNFVLKNVFEHHPDKAAKMGAGIDFVMISKHSSFQESRCLYVVLKDGHKEDFSYRKCLDNYIRKKYPDVAEAFIEKYFSKKPRPPREQSLPPPPPLREDSLPPPPPLGDGDLPPPPPLRDGILLTPLPIQEQSLSPQQ